MAAPTVRICDTADDATGELCNLVIEKANEAVEKTGRFTIGFSGGSTVKSICDGLLHRQKDPEVWKKWRIFFCDERHVPLDDQDSTYHVYETNLFKKVDGLLDEKIPTIFPLDPKLTVENAAEDYITKIRTVFPGEELPRFDLLLLGMGPDGHTCSLFPGHKLLQETKKMIAPISDSPKPPPCRITMTYPLINNCAAAAFLSCGAGKSEVVQRVLQGNEEVPLPAARVRPTNGQLYWFLDKPAAEKLKDGL